MSIVKNSITSLNHSLKSKTALKLIATTVLLSASSTIAVLYYSYVTLAITTGIIHAVPILVFTISILVALASFITLIALTFSVIRNRVNDGKSSEVNREQANEGKKKEVSSQVETKEPEKATPVVDNGSKRAHTSDVPVDALPSVSDLTVPIEETQQPGSVHTTDVYARQTSISTDGFADSIEKGSLPLYPLISSPLNSFRQDQPFPSLPSSIEGSLPQYPSMLPLSDNNQAFPSLPSIVNAGSLPPYPSIQSLSSNGEFPSLPFPAKLRAALNERGQNMHSQVVRICIARWSEYA